MLDAKGDKILYTPGKILSKASVALEGVVKRWKDVRRAADYDVVFVHREAIMLGTTWFEKQMASSASLVFDFDDAIWVKDMSQANARLAFLKRPEKTQELLAMSDLVFAGNDYLADYARQFNSAVKVVPTTIDTSYHLPDPGKKATPVCIGWTGSSTTFKHLEPLFPVLQRIKAQFESQVTFRIIASKVMYIPELDTNTFAWNATDEIAQLQPVDIGLMPLPDDDWARGKCGFKALQYLAVGAPAIVSPVGVNTKVVSDGVEGYHAVTDSEWESAISRLITENGTRQRMGQEGRKKIEAHWSVNAWRKVYLESFESLRKTTK